MGEFDLNFYFYFFEVSKVYDITGCGGPTLRAKGGVGVNSVCMAWACVGRLYGSLHPSVCDIMD